MVVEDAPQEPGPAIEDLLRTLPMRFGCTQMDDKLPSELQGIAVHGVILFFEGHVFKALGNSFVPS